MREITVALMMIGVSGIANAHFLDGDHGLVEGLWHQVVGGHHGLFPSALLLGSVALFFVARWISKNRI